MDNMVVALILSISAWVIILACLIGSMRHNHKIKQQYQEAVQAGLELQRNAIANNKAWQQGIEDQKEIFEAEIMDRDDKVEDLEGKLTASRSNLYRLLTRIHDLEVAHAMHDDHCLPVLEEMRAVKLIPETPPQPSANDLTGTIVGTNVGQVF